MKMFLVLAFALVTSTASAKDVALILNDQEQNALRQALDAATKAQGLQIAPMTVYLLNKLNTAGTVTEKKDDPAPADKPQETPKENPTQDKGTQP